MAVALFFRWNFVQVSKIIYKYILRYDLLKQKKFDFNRNVANLIKDVTLESS